MLPVTVRSSLGQEEASQGASRPQVSWKADAGKLACPVRGGVVAKVPCGQLGGYLLHLCPRAVVEFRVCSRDVAFG